MEQRPPEPSQARLNSARWKLALSHPGFPLQLPLVPPIWRLELRYCQSHPLAPLSAPAVQGVNQVAEALAGQFGGTYASFYDVILGRERELTLITRDDEVNNVHMNDAGYALAAAELIRVASTNNTPEPATLTMFAVGLLGAVGYRGVRRTRVA